MEVPVLFAHPYPGSVYHIGEQEVGRRKWGGQSPDHVLLWELDRAGWLSLTVVMADYGKRSLLLSENETPPIDSLV